MLLAVLAEAASFRLMAISLAVIYGLFRDSPGAKLTLEVGYHAWRKHLPVITLRRVA